MSDCNLEAATQQDQAKPEESLPANPLQQPTAHDVALQKHSELKGQQLDLKKQLNTLKLHLAALGIENDHLEEHIHKLEQQNLQKEYFNQNIKTQILSAAKRAVDNQTRITFPQHFLVQIFAPFAEDQNFMEHCAQIDSEIAKLMHKLRLQAYQAQETKFRSVISKKKTNLQAQLVHKYEAKLAKQERAHQAKVSQLKHKCFELLQHCLIENCKDTEYIKSYLTEMKTLYEQKTQNP
ncbi:uncharacterized protein LOC115761674 [Drosophila novamexicana]|uniref:uncharacterized protein LOC115761674 n=1 Tax=Drosophila novamexicana TaxID=47314 RepID=UPI0011E5F2EB|nr:uncharacterized protein LOC115761674 [Drosophila novamexicana]